MEITEHMAKTLKKEELQVNVFLYPSSEMEMKEWLGYNVLASSINEGDFIQIADEDLACIIYIPKRDIMRIEVYNGTYP